MKLSPEQLRFVLLAAHQEWWTREMQPRLDRAYGGAVPETIQKGLFDASSAGFQAGYSFGYEASEKDQATAAPPGAGSPAPTRSVD